MLKFRLRNEIHVVDFVSFLNKVTGISKTKPLGTTNYEIDQIAKDQIHIKYWNEQKKSRNHHVEKGAR